MSSSQMPAAATRAEVPFTGRGRWVAAVLLVTGTLLQLVEFVLENPIDDNEDRVAYWADHTTRVGISMAAGIAAVPFLIGGFGVLVALCRPFTPRLAWTAAALLTMAMVGLAAIHGLEATAYGLLRAGDSDAAVTALEGEDIGAPGAVVFIMFLGGALFGIITIAVAMWRSPLVPRLSPVCVLGFAVFDFVLGFGVVGHALNVIAFALVAAAVVVGYRRGGTPATVWLPTPRREQHDAALPTDERSG